MILIDKVQRGADTVQNRRLFTSHSGLARLARERVVLGRLTDLAAAIRDHEGQTARQPLGPRPHDAALYRRLRQAGTTRVSRPGH
jgi:hypothetical protein